MTPSTCRFDTVVRDAQGNNLVQAFMTVERMYLAVRPPPEVVDIISDLPTVALRGVRYTRRDQWHITMRFLGDVERNDALGALAGLQAPTATVTLGPEVQLLGTRVVIVPADGLDQVARAVNESFAEIGEPNTREFAGHLTLARLKGQPLRDPSVVSVLGAQISATFSVETVELWKSEVTQDGATHTLVASQELL